MGLNKGCLGNPNKKTGNPNKKIQNPNKKRIVIFV
jgi:hypothetical protein